MPYTLADIERELANDDKVQLAGIDIDGILRGKIVTKAKFLSVAKSGASSSLCALPSSLPD